MVLRGAEWKDVHHQKSLLVLKAAVLYIVQIVQTGTLAAKIQEQDVLSGILFLINK